MGFDALRDLISPSGAVINVVWREAEGEPIAVVHVSHGLGERTSDYGQFAGLLAAGGFHVYAHDHRGHGATRAPDALQGHFGSGDAVEKVDTDMRAVRDFIAERHPSLPIVLFGRATGGLIALDFLMRYPGRVAGLVFENPPSWFGPGRKALLAWERFRLGSDVASQAMSPEASVGSWRVVAAMQDRVFRGRQAGSALRHVPILISVDDAGTLEGSHNSEALAGRLRTRGFSDVTVRRDGGAREAVAAILREWVGKLMG